MALKGYPSTTRALGSFPSATAVVGCTTLCMYTSFLAILQKKKKCGLFVQKNFDPEDEKTRLYQFPGVWKSEQKS